MGLLSEGGEKEMAEGVRGLLSLIFTVTLKEMIVSLVVRVLWEGGGEGICSNIILEGFSSEEWEGRPMGL